MTRAHFITLIGAALALALGALAAKMREPFSTDTAPATPAAFAKPTMPAPAPGRSVSDPLAHALQTETGAKRWLLLLAATEKAGASDMPGLIRTVAADSSAVRMLAARWADLDPSHMLHTLYAEFMLPENAPGSLPSRWTLASVLFEQWTKNDVAAAIKALNDVPEFSGRENLRMTTANEIFKTDVEAGLRAMKDWNIRNYGPDMKGVAAWAARDPRHAAEIVLKDAEGYVAQRALAEVAKAWAQSDPGGGLQFAAGLDPARRAIFGGEVVRSWAARDAKAAAAFAAAQPGGAFRNALGQGLVSEWGRTDAASALAWSQENLHGAARTEAIAGLVKSAAEKNLAAAADLVAGMEPGAAQSRASASIFETWFAKGKGERDAALDWLAALPDAGARSAAIERVQWNWVWNDPDAVREFIAGPHGDLASSSLIHQVARSQAAKNPEAAMQWAAGLPAERAADARRAVLENWLAIRPEAAADYARQLPAGDERDGAIRTVSQSLVFQSPQQAAAWYRTLGDADRKTAREIFDGTGLNDDQRRQLQDAIKK